MTIFETIKNEVRDKVISGAIGIGEKAPSTKNLCDNYGVSHVTALRVLKSLAQDGYISQKAGRGYFVNRINANGCSAELNQVIACVLRPYRKSSLTDNYFNDITQAIHQACMQKHFNMHYPHQALELEEEFVDEKFWLELTESCLEIADKVDGYFLDERIPDPIIRKFISVINKPCVLVGRKTLAGIDTVFSDNVGGTASAAKMCVQMDYKRFFVAHDAYHVDNYNFAERTKSFINALKKAGISEKEITKFEFNITSFEDTFASLEKDIIPGVKTLFFSPNDRFARWLADTMLEHDLPLGNGVGVLGFGEVGYSRLKTPYVSTLDTMPEKIGEKAVELLMERIRGASIKPKNHTVECNFQIGGTL